MKIVCTLLRQGGTVVDFDEKFPPAAKYHFKPETDGGPHVTEVTEKKHIARLLSIPEAYEMYDPDAVIEAAPQTDAPQETDAVAAPPTGDVPLDQKTDEELREYAKEKYGKTFHHNTKTATILAEIANLGG